MALFKRSALDEDNECRQTKRNEINVELTHSVYQFYCEQSSFFIGNLPSKKTVVFEQISDYLRLNETIPITQINTLAELPPTSPTEPKIVVVTQDIDEKLTRDFYGILITQHYFNLKNGAKMYGVLYTTQESDKSNRYVTYSREVVKYFDEHYSIWHFFAVFKEFVTCKIGYIRRKPCSVY
ncbi:Uncharacterised protein [Actinobacillus pleuropneumoniae]|nr:Uncharacterised protein [Actinobacillus pleuropneumoniae]